MPVLRPSRIRHTFARITTIDRDATARDFEAQYYEHIRADAQRRGLEGEAIALRTRTAIAESRRTIDKVAASIERSEATIARAHDLGVGLLRATSASVDRNTQDQS